MNTDMITITLSKEELDLLKKTLQDSMFKPGRLDGSYTYCYGCREQTDIDEDEILHKKDCKLVTLLNKF